MRKKQDVIWETSTLWEQVEKYVMRYLKKNHPKYQQIKVQAAELIEQHSALWQLMNEASGVSSDWLFKWVRWPDKRPRWLNKYLWRQSKFAKRVEKKG